LSTDLSSRFLEARDGLFERDLCRARQLLEPPRTRDESRSGAAHPAEGSRTSSAASCGHRAIAGPPPSCRHVRASSRFVTPKSPH